MPLASKPESPTFYITCERRKRIQEPIESGDIPVMQNAIGYYNAGNFRDFNPYNVPYVIDSGGYSAMDRYGGKFPWSIGQYADWLEQTYETRAFDWAAVMDLACEEDFDDVISVDKRIERTVENTIALLDRDPDVPLLPVLQGREINEWLRCYDMLRDHGIDPEYAGIGTLCRQSSGKKIAEIVRALRARTDIDAFHGFGVKITAFKEGVLLESADSQAWSWPIQFGEYYDMKGDGPEIIQRPYGEDPHHAESLQNYYQYVSHLQRRVWDRNHGEQITLF